RYSSGIPRVVNILCDHCLLYAYAEQIREVDAALVQRAITYLEEGDAQNGGRRRMTSGGGLIARYASRRLFVTCSAVAVAVAAAASVPLAPSGFGSALPGGPAMMTAISAVGRWISHWWGS